MSYCVNCGVELNPGARACPLCGTPAWNPDPAAPAYFPTHSAAVQPASRRDAACAAVALALEGHELLQLVVNRVQPRLFSRMNLTVDDMMDQTGLPLLGLVPEDPAVVLSAAAGKALILNSSGGAAEACLRISRRLRGEPMPLMRF